MQPIDRRQLLTELVSAARQKMFGDVCAFTKPTDSSEFRPLVGRDGKENWLFHAILDQIEANASTIGLPHFVSKYQILGEWSEAKWVEQRITGRLPECVPTHRGPLTSAEVLEGVRRNWQKSLAGRTSEHTRLRTSLGEFETEIAFSVSAESGVVWVSVEVKAVIDQRWEQLSKREDRHDRRVHLLPPDHENYIAEAESFAQSAAKRGHHRVVAFLRDHIFDKYKVYIKTGLMLVLMGMAVTLGTYNVSAEFRKAMRRHFPGPARLLDRLTAQPAEPPSPRRRPGVPRPRDVGRIIELGDVVPAEPVVDAEELFVTQIVYDKRVASVAPLVVVGSAVQPQILATRSRKDPQLVYFRVFLGDLWRGIVEDYFLDFGDHGGFIAFEASTIEQRPGRYRGFMTAYRYPKHGSYDVRLLATLKSGNPAEGIFKRIYLAEEIEKGPQIADIDYLDRVSPYKPREEDVRPDRDAEIYPLILSDVQIRNLARSPEGELLPQILTEDLGGRRVLFRVILGKQFESETHATVIFDDIGLRHFGSESIPRSTPAGFSVIHEFSSPGMHGMSVWLGNTWSAAAEPHLRKVVNVGTTTHDRPPTGSAGRKGPDP